MKCLIATFIVVSSVSKFVAAQVYQHTKETVAETEDDSFFNKDFLSSLELQSDLADKFATLDTQAAVDNFFNFTGVATTPLGKVTSWVGDFAYPTMLIGVAVFSFYAIFQLVAQLFGLAYNTKVNLLSTLFGWLSTSDSVVVQKFVSVATDEDVEEAVALRSRRSAAPSGFLSEKHLWDLASGVYRAINKYEEEH